MFFFRSTPHGFMRCTVPFAHRRCIASMRALLAISCTTMNNCVLIKSVCWAADIVWLHLVLLHLFIVNMLAATRWRGSV